jgi:hypothetical protein
MAYIPLLLISLSLKSSALLLPGLKRPRLQTNPIHLDRIGEESVNLSESEKLFKKI